MTVCQHELAKSITFGSLQAILPQSTGRYDVSHRSERLDIIVDAVMFASGRDDSPTYLPPSWSYTVHPEGKLYFYSSGSIRAVTESNLQDSEVSEKITRWTAHIRKCASGLNMDITPNMELFLQIDGDNCNYYFADHVTRTVFWLTSDESDNMGLLPVVSRLHMKHQLQAQYWTHVENFCNHIGGLSLECIDELIQIFSHGFADNLTSSLSTFPYDAEATEKFLKLLTSSRNTISEGYTVAIVARLWGLIMYNRYETHFGEEQARLSRDASILEDTSNEIQWTKAPASILTFKMSETFNSRLDSLFVDQIVFGKDFSLFMKYCLKSWQQSAITSCVLILLHGLCFLLPVCPALAYLSATLASMSILTSTFLIHRHNEILESSAVPAHDYLSSIISTSFKFQPAAVAFSLPRTFFLYSLIAFFSQWAIILCQYVNLLQAAFFTGIVGCVFLGLHIATSSTQLRRPSFKWKSEHAKDADQISGV